jgi:hypothetical protein
LVYVKKEEKSVTCHAYSKEEAKEKKKTIIQVSFPW